MQRTRRFRRQSVYRNDAEYRQRSESRDVSVNRVGAAKKEELREGGVEYEGREECV